MSNSVDPDQTAPIVCSGATLFASILNLSVMLGNHLQQTTSADVRQSFAADNFSRRLQQTIFSDAFFGGRFKGYNCVPSLIPRMLGNISFFMILLSSGDFFKINFLKQYFGNTIRKSNGFNPDC